MNENKKMVCSEIPIDFYNRVYDVLNQRFSNIKYIDDDRTMYGTILGPKSLTTQHKLYTIGSKEHINDLVELHYILDLLRTFADKHGIVFSLAYGNLLGYYREGGQIFWDDDIDVILTVDHYDKLFTLLCNTTDDEWSRCEDWAKSIWNSYLCKDIIIEGIELILVQHPLGFFKIKLNYECPEHDIGGLDIFNTDYDFKKQNALISKLDDRNNLELIEYHTVPTYVYKKDVADQMLNLKYGDDWSEHEHPSLKSK